MPPELMRGVSGDTRHGAISCCAECKRLLNDGDCVAVLGVGIFHKRCYFENRARLMRQGSKGRNQSRGGRAR